MEQVEGYAAGWTGWWEGIEALLLLTVCPFSPQVAVGWGDLAVLQVVADLSPPSCTPPVVGGGGGGARGCTANQTVTHPEPQPIATKVGWGLKMPFVFCGGKINKNNNESIELASCHSWKSDDSPYV
jgi:hypothetical protein